MDKLILPSSNITNDGGFPLSLNDIRQILGDRDTPNTENSKGIYDFLINNASKHSNGVISGCKVSKFSHAPVANSEFYTEIKPSNYYNTLSTSIVDGNIYGEDKLKIDTGYVLINGDICYFSGDTKNNTNTNTDFRKPFYFVKTQTKSETRIMRNGDTSPEIYYENKATLTDDVIGLDSMDYILFIELIYTSQHTRNIKLVNYVFDYFSTDIEIISPKSNKLSLLTSPITTPSPRTGCRLDLIDDYININTNTLNLNGINTNNTIITNEAGGTYIKSNKGLQLESLGMNNNINLLSKKDIIISTTNNIDLTAQNINLNGVLNGDSIFFKFSYTNNGITTTKTRQLTDTLVANIGTTSLYVKADSSDSTLKSNIIELPYNITTITKLSPVLHNWNEKYKEKYIKSSGIVLLDNATEEEKQSYESQIEKYKKECDKTEIGLIAQDVLEIIPEVVGKDEDGYYTINYPKLVPVLINGIKEQQDMILKQQEIIEKQQAQLDLILKRLEKLEK